MRALDVRSGRAQATVASWAVLLLVTGLVGWLALRSDGVPPVDSELHDGGIWVVSNAEGRYGRMNKPIAELDGVVYDDATGADLDVLQEGAVAVGWNRGERSLVPLDGSLLRTVDVEEATLPRDAVAVLHGGTLAAADPATGRVWATAVDPVAGTVSTAGLAAEAPELAEAGAGAALTVTARGDVVVVSADRDRLTRLVRDRASYAGPRAEAVEAGLGGDVAATAVGETVVVHDRDAERLVVPGGPTVAGVPARAVLQRPGPEAEEVLVATPDALLAVRLDDGRVRTVRDGLAGLPAAPVRVGACAYGAWSDGSGTVVVQCAGSTARVRTLAEVSDRLAFRENRGQVVLNDADSGAVWEVDADEPTRIDNWDAFRQQVRRTDDRDRPDESGEQQRTPPRARDDEFGARPGRTTVLHPLDNDSMAPGGVLSVFEVSDVKGSDADVRVSPDGQTVLFTMPTDAPARTSFEYYVDDGRGSRARSATVTVVPRRPAQNGRPELRHAFAPRAWTVPSGGTVDVPVLPDWRDPADGDPVFLLGAAPREGAAAGAARAQLTASGRVRFFAPPEAGDVTVGYEVADGRGDPVTGSFRVRVQERKDRETTPPVAEPDVATGEVGRPVVVHPLLNDLPGSDPSDLDAELRLTREVVAPGGASVRTDLSDGSLTVVADRPRTYFLEYQVGYGHAEPVEGLVRVDVRDPATDDLVPTAMPDEAIMYGDSSIRVDVLDNDLDPSGGVLVVGSAEAEDDECFRTGVVEHRWVKVTPTGACPQRGTHRLAYTMGNGTTEGTPGEILVARKAAPRDNAPVTQTDHVRVRAGAGVSVPVLDNDVSPSGGELTLDQQVPGTPAGRLPVLGLDSADGAGEAFVAGTFVRYVAPPRAAETETFEVPYVARGATGESAPGRLLVTVVPAGGNLPPEPPDLEGRTVAGDAVRVRLPGVDLDPDGDLVTVVGVDEPPELGRVVRVGANSLLYQAFPGSTGTDQLSYRVTDSGGETATGVVRVAIVPPEQPQAPLAVDDRVDVEPGRTATVDLLANDAVAAGDRVALRLVDPPDGVRLRSRAGPVTVPTGGLAPGEQVQVEYRISNGLDTSQATVAVRAVAGVNNPPVVGDVFARAGDSARVSVDVLARAWDPDGPASGLRATIQAPPGVDATVDPGTGRVRVLRGDVPVVLPFRVTDERGGAAAGSLFVPALGFEMPVPREGAVLRLEPGETTTARLAELVEDAAGARVAFTTRDAAATAPDDALRVRVTGNETFEVTARRGFRGPAAVNAEVTTGTNTDSSDGVTATVPIPVQVGETRPVLVCPADPLVVPQGGRVELDVASYCHVWTEDPAEAASLEYAARWAEREPGLSLADSRGPAVVVEAGYDARSGAQAELRLSAGGSRTVSVPVVVDEVAPPRLAPISARPMRSGQQQTIDLGRFFTAGLEDPEVTVVSAAQVSRLPGMRIERSGGARVTVTAGPRAHGTAVFRVVLSDVDGPARSRRVSGRFGVDVTGRPDAPAAPAPGRIARSREMPLSWTAPDANGARIDHYLVRNDAGRTQRCATTSCSFTGLRNGTRYRFSVRAVNAVGASPWSRWSRPAMPDAPPGQVSGIRMTRWGDGWLALRWNPPSTQTSRIRRYHVSWAGGRATAAGTRVVVRRLDNNRRYTFTVAAENALDIGRGRTSAPYQSAGDPRAPGRPRTDAVRTADNQAAVNLRWPAVRPNGPGPVRYTVVHNGRARCAGTRETRCRIGGLTYDGRTHSFAVRAVNGRGLRSPLSPTSRWKAIGDPQQFERFDTTVRRLISADATFRVPHSRGRVNRVSLLVNGAVVRQENLKAKEGQVLTWAYRNPDFDAEYPAQVRVCNERSCTTSRSDGAWTYGHLNSKHLLGIHSQVDHKRNRIRWHVTVDTNGRRARMVAARSIWRSGTRLRTRYPERRLPTRDRITVTFGWVEHREGTFEKLRIRLEDPIRGRRSRWLPRSGPVRSDKIR